MGIKDASEGYQPITYGVWIDGIGWLRDNNGRIFADPRIKYARSALKMWNIGGEPKGTIKLIDESMIGLQQIFLDRASRKPPSFTSKLRRLIYGVLGIPNRK